VRLLVVEDQANHRKVIQGVLESQGYQVLAAKDAAQARAFLKPETALVLTDVISGTAFRFGARPSLDAVRALLKLAEKPYLPAVRAKAAAALSRLADTLR